MVQFLGLFYWPGIVHCFCLFCFVLIKGEAPRNRLILREAIQPSVLLHGNDMFKCNIGYNDRRNIGYILKWNGAFS